MTKGKIEILREIAKEVYFQIHPLLGTVKSSKIVGLGFGGDNTKLIDKVAEETIIRYLRTHHLSCVFIGEEMGIRNIGTQPEFYLITDPIDGTTNAVRGIGFAASSLAISSTNSLENIEASVVIDLFNGSIYEAEKNMGARKNGNVISTSRIEDLKNSVIGIDISRSSRTLQWVTPLVRTVRSVRSFGSAALEICQVGAGILEAYIDLRTMLRTTDIAASILIIEESGGIIQQPDGKSFQGIKLSGQNRLSIIAAANKQIYKKILFSIGDKTKFQNI